MTCWCWDLVLLKFSWFSNDKTTVFFRDRRNPSYLEFPWKKPIPSKPIRASKNTTFDPSSFKHFAPLSNPPMCRSIIYRAAAQPPIFGMKQQFCKTWNFEIPKSLEGPKWGPMGPMGPILPRWLEKVPKNRLSQIVVWFMVIYPWHKVKKKKTLLRQIQVGGSNGIYDPLVHSLDSYIVYMSL